VASGDDPYKKSVRKGADIGSNHHLVAAHVKLNLRRTGIPVRMLKHFDVSKMKDAEIRKQFVLQVHNCFAALEDIDERHVRGGKSLARNICTWHG